MGEKTKFKRIVAVVLATVVLFISFDVQGVRAAGVIPAVMGAAEIVFTALMGAGGVSFATPQDAKNAYVDLYIRNPSVAKSIEDLVFEQVYEFTGSEVITNDSYTMWEALLNGDVNYLFNVGVGTLASLFMELSSAFTDFTKTDIETGESFIENKLSEYPIIGYYNDTYVLSNYLWEGYWISNVNNLNKYQLNTKILHEIGNGIYVGDRINGIYYIQLAGGIGGNGWYNLVSDYSRIGFENVSETSNYKAVTDSNYGLVVSPSNAISRVAKLGGVTVDDPGAEIGIRLPTDLGTLVDVTPGSIVIDLGTVIAYPPQTTTQPTTQPTTEPTNQPSEQPSPEPTKNPPKLPTLPPILTGIESIIDKLNRLLQQENLPGDDTGVPGALADLLTELENIKERLNLLDETDPDYIPQLKELANEITSLQNIIDEQKNIIGQLPEYDPTLINQLDEVNNEMEELKESMDPINDPDADPDNDSKDYTNLLDKIINILTQIMIDVSNLPQTVTDAVKTVPDKLVGTMEITRKNDDDDFDITMVFPFCIPFDLIRMFESLQVGGPNGEGTPPRYEAEIMGVTWVIDFADFSFIKDTVRWSLWISFVIGLMMATSKVIKWGN